MSSLSGLEWGLMLIRTPMLEPSECAALARKIVDMRRFWKQRDVHGASFTLGAAAYLDVPDSGMAGYITGLTRGNTLMRRHFEALHARLKDVLSRALEGPVSYDARLALPGFHIFVGVEGIEELEPKRHFDLQDDLLDFDGLALRTISYTLPLAIPIGGAGLRIWNVSRAEALFTPAAAFEDLVEGRRMERNDYALGELFVHEGTQLHQIDDDHAFASGDMRITLQGHGRLSKEGWCLYW
jgi:hypothetical protein